MILSHTKQKNQDPFFIEICNVNRGKNIIGIVKQPYLNETILKSLVDKIGHVSKNVYFIGDFNLGLLNVSLIITFTFFDTMVSKFLLLVINPINKNEESL